MFYKNFQICESVLALLYFFPQPRDSLQRPVHVERLLQIKYTLPSNNNPLKG